MPKQANVHDAWDDDWQTAADRDVSPEPASCPAPAPRLTKKERLAQHAETNRKLWQTADTPPEPLHFVDALSTTGGGGAPLTTIAKPIRMLSRRPAPPAAPQPVSLARKDGGVALSVSQLNVQDDDDDEDDEPEKETAEEAKVRRDREREDKRKRYEEARARIFGDGGDEKVQPRQPSPREATASPRGNRTRGGKNPRGFADRSRGRTGAATPPTQKELYDPNSTPKSGITIQKRTESEEHRSLQPVREPRMPGPGAGFARRGET